MLSLETILWLAGSLAEAVVVALLIYRCAWRNLPVFFAYSIWTLVASVASYIIFQDFPKAYLTTYFVEIIADSVLLFGVLVELGWSILLPLHSSLSKKLLVIIGVLILALGAAIWPFVSFPGAANVSAEMATVMHIQQTFSVLRVVVFLALAACSQLLSIGWRDRELQIATGLGFNSLVGLTAAVIHSHQTTKDQYRHMNDFVVASYLCSLLYWIFSFAQQEERRREFTPQMQTLLMTLAGTARSTRGGMTDMVAARSRKRGPM
jgi:uncharacterized membrane protein YczE